MLSIYFTDQKHFLREKIRFPLVVNFVGEDAGDGGGPRDELVSMVLDSMGDTIESVDKLFSSPLETENIDRLDIESRLFAFGVWASIAIVQCGFTPKFLLKWMNLAESHPFIMGANLLETPKVR